MPLLRVVSGLAVCGSRIFMGKRPAGKMRSGLWELPGGKVDHGEEPRAALKREWREELGVDIEVHEFIASSMLTMEVPFCIELYAVSGISSHSKIELNAHDEIGWPDPTYAMRYMPCAPAYYMQWPQIVDTLNRR